ncbi:hypothetical protein [Schaalia hyovaginalis]|nr:hypothetical protein [Schaalia hyovaginalis]
MKSGPSGEPGEGAVRSARVDGGTTDLEGGLNALNAYVHAV